MERCIFCICNCPRQKPFTEAFFQFFAFFNVSICLAVTGSGESVPARHLVQVGSYPLCSSSVGSYPLCSSIGLGRVAWWLATCARKPKALGSSPAASYVQR